MRLVNEVVVVVKGREYQGNVFDGFRGSTILGCYDNRGRRTAVVVSVVVAVVVAVVGVVTKVRKRKAKSRAPKWCVISCTPYMPVRDASLCCKSVTCNVNTPCNGHSSLRLSFAINPVRIP